MGNPIFSANSEYAAEFLQYLGTHPEAAERIPEGVVVVFLPEHEADLMNLQALFPDHPIQQALGATGDFLYWYVEFEDYPSG